MSDITIPDTHLYSKEHEWIDTTTPEVDQIVSVGITAVATDALGEIVYVDLPSVGSVIEADDQVGEVESTKSVSDIFSPVSGEVVEVNEDLEDNAGVINEDPYGAGWMFKVRVSEVPELLTADEYHEFTGK